MLMIAWHNSIEVQITPSLPISITLQTSNKENIQELTE